MQGSLLGHLMHHGMFGFGIRDVGHARDALSLFLSLSFCLCLSLSVTSFVIMMPFGDDDDVKWNV